MLSFGWSDGRPRPEAHLVSLGINCLWRTARLVDALTHCQQILFLGKHCDTIHDSQL